MLNLKTTLTGLAIVACGVLSAFTPAYGASLLTSSKDDFISQQGANGWFYGYDNGNGFQMDLNPGWGSFSASGGSLNGQNNPNWIVRRWESNFNGIVSLSGLMPKTLSGSSAVNFKQQIRVDGQTLLSQTSSGNNGHSIYDLDRIKVNAGSIVDFAFAPTDSTWSGQFDLMAEIEAPSGLIFMDRYPRSPKGHVGLFVDGKVYEANPLLGFVQDTSFNEFVRNSSNSLLPHDFVELPEVVAKAMGNHIETKLGAGYLPWKVFQTPPEQKGKSGLFTNSGLIEWAAEQAGVNAGQGFIFNDLEFLYVNGIDCYKISCSQLDPWNLKLEQEDSIQIVVDRVFGTKLNSFSFGDFKNQISNIGDGIQLLLACPAIAIPEQTIEGIDCSAINKIPQDPILGIPRPGKPFPDLDNFIFYDHFGKYYKDAISTYDLKRLINPFKASNWLQGSLDSVDFILTDPLGRQIGYTQELGFFNEIPNLLYTANNISGLENAEGQNAPLIAKPKLTTNLDSVASDPCSPEETPPAVEPVQPISEIFQFFIFDRLPGEYKIEQIGRSQNSKSTIGNGTNTVTTTLDTCQSNQIITNGDDVTKVPEPSSILGLIVLGLLGARIKKRR